VKLTKFQRSGWTADILHFCRLVDVPRVLVKSMSKGEKRVYKGVFLLQILKREGEHDGRVRGNASKYTVRSVFGKYMKIHIQYLPFKSFITVCKSATVKIPIKSKDLRNCIELIYKVIL
jgi:hypothetical protein